MSTGEAYSLRQRKRKRVDAELEDTSEDEEDGVEDSIEDAGGLTAAPKARQKGKKAVVVTKPGKFAAPLALPGAYSQA